MSASCCCRLYVGLLLLALSSFLDNITRISEPDYLPTTGNTGSSSLSDRLLRRTADDILNVRLQTLGVIEHNLTINTGGSIYDWKLYDVGGAVRPIFSSIISSPS